MHSDVKTLWMTLAATAHLSFYSVLGIGSGMEGHGYQFSQGKRLTVFKQNSPSGQIDTDTIVIVLIARFIQPMKPDPLRLQIDPQ